MKKAIIIVGIIVVALVVAVVIYLTLSTKWRGRYLNYQNSRYGFSVDYPIGWKLADAPTNNDGREFIYAEKSIACHAYGFYNSLPGKDGKPQTLDEYINWLNDNTVRALEVGVESPYEMQDATIDGRPAKRIYSSGLNFAEDAVYTLDSEVGYGFSCTYPDEQTRQDYKDIFDHMLESMQIETPS